jgi:predicted MFS family arabinose efflux permease
VDADDELADQNPAPQAQGVLRDIAEGIRWLAKHPAMRTLVITIVAFNVTYGAAWSVLVLYVRDQLGMGEIGYGIVTAAAAVGGILGTVGYDALTRRFSLGNLMRAGLIIETLTHLSLALTRTPLIALAIFFVFGAHAFVWGTTATTIRQRAVPDELYGRVSGVYRVGIFGGLVVGAPIGGFLARTFGIAAPFWFGFVGSAILVALLWREFSLIAHDDEGAQPAAA